MSSIADAPLHPGAEPLAFLLGTWRGGGEGTFHTTGPFRYEEEIRFTHRGRPWLVYDQRSWSPDDGSPIHTEMGFWRPVDDGLVNVFISLTAGTDLSAGPIEGTSLSLETVASPMADGIERVTVLRRSYAVEGDRLSYQVVMGTDGRDPARHVAGSLRRLTGSPDPGGAAEGEP